MTRLGVIFGSRSVEHEVSILTAVELFKHVDREKYSVVPIYIDKQGRWLQHPDLEHLSFFTTLETVYDRVQQQTPSSEFFTNAETHLQKIDVALVCCHGTYGEDGTLQGMLDMLGIPHQGPGVLGSAICMDKICTKQILQTAQIPVVPYTWFTQSDWQQQKTQVLQACEQLDFPLFVKPANLGSSVGIAKTKTVKELETAISVALAFDDRVLVEHGIEDCLEVNVSVLGHQTFEVSETEQPIKTDEILSYADKYERGGGKKTGMSSLNRRIPAPISSSLRVRLQQCAIQAAKVMDLSGVTRIDFLTEPATDRFWLNELNTIPGSLSNYLWSASGIRYTQLIDRLVHIAQERVAVDKTKTHSISTKII